MTDDKKKQLFPYFAYLYSQELNPEKYGEAESIEEWTELIQDSPEDVERISEAAAELSDEEWAQLEEQYASAEESPEDVETAKKGAKLKKLQEFKKGAKMGKKKKCACGCDLITKKEKGGTIVDTCTCCGGVHKHQEGGIMKFQNPSGEIREIKPGYYQGYHSETNFKTAASKNRALVERFLSNYLKNPNVKKALARAEWEARPSTGNFDATQSPHYFGNDPVWQVARQVQAPSNRTSSNTPQGVAPALTPTPGTTGTQPTGGTGGTGGAPQRVATQSDGLTSTSGTVKTPSRNNAGGVPTQSPNQRGNRNTSVVDYLNSIGENSSFNDRKQLASVLGIQNYRGSSAQNIQLLNLLKEGKGSLGALKQNLVHNPVIAPISEKDLASMQSKRVPTTVAANRKGGLIEKVQKGTKTKEEYIGNHETWDPKNVGTGDNSMNPKDWSPEKKKADREAWLNRNKKVTKKPVPSKKEVGLPKKK